jgi:protein involved in polysaccharide export with SLBB domain
MTRRRCRHFTTLLRPAASVAVVVLTCTATAGCASKYADLKAFVQAHNHDVVGTTYRLEPPDVISISSPTAPEIHGETLRIGSDGKVTLRLLGSVKVSSMSPKEVAAKLEQLLSRYYVEPKVEVQVVGYASKKVYVFGQVNDQGPKRFTGRDTLMDVLANAQPTIIAWGARVRVIRPSANPDEIREITVNVDRMLEEGDLRGNFLLQAGDIVYVPPTPLGWVGLRIQEILFPFSPLVSAYAWPANVAAAGNVYDDFGERSAGGLRGLGAGGGRFGGFGNRGATGGWGE